MAICTLQQLLFILNVKLWHYICHNSCGNVLTRLGEWYPYRDHLSFWKAFLWISSTWMHSDVTPCSNFIAGVIWFSVSPPPFILGSFTLCKGVRLVCGFYWHASNDSIRLWCFDTMIRPMWVWWGLHSSVSSAEYKMRVCIYNLFLVEDVVRVSLRVWLIWHVTSLRRITTFSHLCASEQYFLRRQGCSLLGILP